MNNLQRDIRELVTENKISLTFSNRSVKDSPEFIGINLHVLQGANAVTMKCEINMKFKHAFP